MGGHQPAAPAPSVPLGSQPAHGDHPDGAGQASHACPTLESRGAEGLNPGCGREAPSSTLPCGWAWTSRFTEPPLPASTATSLIWGSQQSLLPKDAEKVKGILSSSSSFPASGKPPAPTSLSFSFPSCKMGTSKYKATVQRQQQLPGTLQLSGKAATGVVMKAQRCPPESGPSPGLQKHTACLGTRPPGLELLAQSTAGAPSRPCLKRGVPTGNSEAVPTPLHAGLGALSG